MFQSLLSGVSVNYSIYAIGRFVKLKMHFLILDES